MSEAMKVQCGRNLTDKPLRNISAEQTLLRELELERERLNALFQQVQHFADPQILEISQRLDELVVKILQLKKDSIS